MCFCLRIPFGVIVVTLLCLGCRVKDYAKREKDVSFTDVEVLVSYWDSTRRRASFIDYISDKRYLDRSIDAYMYIALTYIDSKTKQGSSSKRVPLPDTIELDFDYLLRHLKDTIETDYRHGLLGLPVKRFDWQDGKVKLRFSYPLPTTSPNHFVVVAQLDKPRDPHRMIFLLRRKASEYEVIDYYWEDGPMLYIPPEEDLLEQDYQRMYGG